jgi:hypothetical protein
MKRTILIIGLALVVVLLVSPAFAATWRVPEDFAEIQEAVYSTDVAPGDTIRVGPGYWAGATVNKPVVITGEDGAVINDGPIWDAGSAAKRGFGLLAGSDGATISHLQFEEIGQGVYAEGVSNVTVTQCRFSRVGQGVSFWNVQDCNITHNEVHDMWIMPGPTAGAGSPPSFYYVGPLGGIILGVKFTSDKCTGNVVSYNKILGTVIWMLDAPVPSSWAAAAAGITPYCSLPRTPPFKANDGEITRNFIVYNKIAFAIEERLPSNFTGRAIPFRENRAVSPCPKPSYVLDGDDGTTGNPIFGSHDNTIAFNDLRGTQFSLATNWTGVPYIGPCQLDHNTISRNLLEPLVLGPDGITPLRGPFANNVKPVPGAGGDNRGHGLTPASELKP